MKLHYDDGDIEDNRDLGKEEWKLDESKESEDQVRECMMESVCRRVADSRAAFSSQWRHS